MKVRGSGTAPPPVNSAPEKSKPGCCRSSGGGGAHRHEEKGGYLTTAVPARILRTMPRTHTITSPRPPTAHLLLESLEQQALLVCLHVVALQLVPLDRAAPGLPVLRLGQLNVQLRAVLERPERLGRLDGAAQVALRGGREGGREGRVGGRNGRNPRVVSCRRIVCVWG